MTIVAAHALTAGVVIVAENGFENVTRLRRPAIRSKRVADVTGTDLALGCVATVAIIVGGDANWN